MSHGNELFHCSVALDLAARVVIQCAAVSTRSSVGRTLCQLRSFVAWGDLLILGFASISEHCVVILPSWRDQ